MRTWLRPLSWLYGTGAGFYHGLYDRGLRETKKLPAPVVSVGNLSAGGTGKTPTVRWLAQALLDRGRRPAILTRGYGGRRAGILIDGQYRGIAAGAREFGDEPVMLSRSLGGVPVVVNRDRYRGGMAFWNGGGHCDVFLLDDGFQHRRLERQSNLVLLDPRTRLINSNLLPNGPLRESIEGLSRSTCLLTLGEAHPEPAEALPGGIPRFLARVRAVGLRALGSEEVQEPASLRDRPLRAVAGIANPQRFRDTLRLCGGRVEALSAYPDHHVFTARDIRREENEAAARGELLVTTEKDAVRLGGATRDAWWVLETALDLAGDREAFLEAVLGPALEMA